MSYELITDLEGKVGNLPDFRSDALYPVFEAVVNSIHAIWASGNPADGRIVVTIERQSALSSDGDDGEIIAFEIEDNGVGFTPENMKSFLTADSTYKKSLGCKGIGRFLWLKAFDKVEIDSVYEGEDGQHHRRRIYFSLGSGIKPGVEEPGNGTRQTLVRLVGFKPAYRSLPTAYKTTRKIAQRILEHCLSYYITDGAPEIVVRDKGESLELSRMYDDIRHDIEAESIHIESLEFIIHHMRLYSTYEKMHKLVLCGNGRGVKSTDIGRILGMTGQFDAEANKFVYAVYVTSNYLDAYVDTSRMGFSIPEDGVSLFREYPVSLSGIREAVVARSKEYLAPYLEQVDRAKADKLDRFTEENPAYRAVRKYCPEVKDDFDPNTSDQKMFEIVARHKGIAEYRLREDSARLLKTQAQSVDEVRAEYESIAEQIDAFSKDNLASYMVFRRMIIDLLEQKLKWNADHKYPNEDIVHDIIFPRKANSDTINYDQHNLWLIDERLTFHAFAASDPELRQILDSEDSDRPDIVVFTEVDGEGLATTVSLIELKKAQRKEYRESLVDQLLRIVRKLQNREVMTPSGRPIHTAASTRYYCYGVCDVTQEIVFDAENHKLVAMKDNRGYYGYVDAVNTYIEILAFDRLLADVRRRHKLFFDALGI